MAHNPPLDRQASWHQCPTECQRVEQLVSTDCGKRMKSKKISTREPCAARTNWLSATRDTPRPGPHTVPVLFDALPRIGEHLLQEGPTSLAWDCSTLHWNPSRSDVQGSRAPLPQALEDRNATAVDKKHRFRYWSYRVTRNGLSSPRRRRTPTRRNSREKLMFARARDIKTANSNEGARGPQTGDQRSTTAPLIAAVSRSIP